MKTITVALDYDINVGAFEASLEETSQLLLKFFAGGIHGDPQELALLLTQQGEEPDDCLSWLSRHVVAQTLDGERLDLFDFLVGVEAAVDKMLRESAHFVQVGISFEISDDAATLLKLEWPSHLHPLVIEEVA